MKIRSVLDDVSRLHAWLVIGNFAPLAKKHMLNSTSNQPFNINKNKKKKNTNLYNVLPLSLAPQYARWLLTIQCPAMFTQQPPYSLFQLFFKLTAIAGLVLLKFLLGYLLQKE